MATPSVRHRSAFTVIVDATSTPDFDADPGTQVLRALGKLIADSGLSAQTANGRSSAEDDGIWRTLIGTGEPVTFSPSRRDDDLAFEAVAYRHHDVLVTQVMCSSCAALPMREGYSATGEHVLNSFNRLVLEEASATTIGASLFYWQCAPEGTSAATIDDEVSALLADPGQLLARTDVGCLWLSPDPDFLMAPTVSQDRWVLVTTPEAAQSALPRFVHGGLGTPPFVTVSIARHKWRYEMREYEHGSRLARRTRAEMADTTRDIASALEEFKGPDLPKPDATAALQQAVIRAARVSSELQEVVSRFRALQRTLDVNRINFTTHAPTLLSEAGHGIVRGSQRPEESASAYLDAYTDEVLFSRQIADMQRSRQQIDADLDYLDHDIRRNDLARQTAQLQLQLELQVAGQTELREMASLHSVEAAAVVASLIAIVAAEAMKLGGEEHSIAGTNGRLAFNVLLLAAAGSFALVRLFATFNQKKTLIERGSVAVTGGFAVGTVVAWIWGRTIPLHADIGFVVVGALLSLVVFEFVEASRRGKRTSEGIERRL